MELVSIVMVARNAIPFLPISLRRLKGQSYTNAELIVVDNASADGSPEFIESHFPSATVIRCASNTGFSRGNNIGIKLASGDYVLVLNQDVYLETDFIEHLVEAIRSDSAIGTACGKIFQACIDGTPGGLVDSAGMVLLKNRNALNRGSGQRDSAELGRAAEVFGAPASATLYRRKMLEELRIGEEYFDEDFFAYFEDVDLSWRARRLGWRAICQPHAVGYHVKLGGHPAPSNRLRFVSELLWRNRYLAILKNDSLFDFILGLPSIVWFELAQFVISLVCRQWRFRALGRALRLMPSVLRKRRAFCRSAPRRLVHVEHWVGDRAGPIAS